MKVIYDITVLGRAHLLNHARTGIFRVVENLAFELAKSKKVELHFCSTGSINDLIACQEYLKGKIELKHVKLHYPKSAKFILPSLRSIDGFKKNNKLYQRYNFFRKLVDFFNYRLALLFQKIFFVHGIHVEDKNEQFDIYHSPFNPLPSKFKKQQYGSIFITIYDTLPFLFPDFFQKETIQHLTKVTDCISRETWLICISEQTKKDILDHKKETIDINKIYVTVLGASNIFYKSEDQQFNRKRLADYGIPASPYILSLCTLDPRKNLVQAINAFEDFIVSEKLDDLNLVLVGGHGSEYKKIQDRIDSNEKIRGRVILTGYVDDDDLSAIYSEALMFVYPSLYEGFGLPPLEAMQCGIPVITSNNSSLPEVVGDAALLVDPNNKLEIMRAMKSLYDDSYLRKKLSHRGLERSTNFSWSKCAAQTLEAYRASLDVN